MKKIKFVIPIAVFAAGLLILFYPFYSDLIFRLSVQKDIIAPYEERWNIADETKKAEFMGRLKAYNERLKQSDNVVIEPFAEEQKDDLYKELKEEGVLGILRAPSADIELPVYFGTDEETLDMGVGHLEKTYFPLRQEGIKTVICGHTGMHASSMFNNLNKMKIGDMFQINIMGEITEYKVIKIDITLPGDIEELYPEQGKTLVVLYTCTPYGINNKRLLVTGEIVN